METKTTSLAVLFADITNSTGLFLGIGDIAANRLQKDWMAEVQGIVTRCDGVFVKGVGDEAMCVFPTADAAVLAACDIQTTSRNRPFSDHALKLHIGAHFGPVVDDGGDIFGDTVNVASYLCALARADQVLIAAPTFRELSPGLNAYARPIFRTRLKSHPEETILYQVLWNTGDLDVTVNLFSERTEVEPVPAESSGLLLTHAGRRTHMNFRKHSLVIGRSADCDLVIDAPWVSRRHAHIRLVGNDFYLFDESINATFVTLEDGREIEVLHNDFPLAGSGRIALGRRAGSGPAAIIEFARDRRSLYRP